MVPSPTHPNKAVRVLRQPARAARAEALESIVGRETEAVVNLAARAGVRQSLLDPAGYYDTNLTGTLNEARGHVHVTATC